MPAIKVQNMSDATTVQAADALMLIQNGSNKKITIATLLNNITSNTNIRINPNQLALDVSIASLNDASMFVMKGNLNRIGIGTSNPLSKFHVSGDIQAGSDSSNGVIIQSSESVSYTASDAGLKQISPLRAMSLLNCDSGISGTFSLSNGSNGQIKTIAVNALDNGKNITVDLTGLGFNRITFSHATAPIGSSVTIQYSSLISKWIVITGHQATYSTV